MNRSDTLATPNSRPNGALSQTSGWTIAGADDEVKQRVNHVVESTALSWDEFDRRVSKRHAFPHLLQLTPIAEGDEIVQIGEPISVVGKWLSEQGLDFFHPQIISFRRAIVSFQDDADTAAHFILNIAWSRFLQPGWYDSGGRLTHVVLPTEDSARQCQDLEKI